MIWAVLIPADQLYAQKKPLYTRLLQLSLTPGVSTNGLHPGGYANYFSLNLTSGYSSKNYLFELGVVSNLNVNETRGLQVAGLVNITGANAFAGLPTKDVDKKIRSGYEANLSGGQFSGLANIVVTHVFGWQATGGLNVIRGALVGVQLSGVSNTVKKYSFGLQLAGLWNVSVESMDGVQVAGIFNATEGGLYGLQFGVFNSAGYTEGKNSFNPDDPWGVQIGLVNVAKKMNGFQVGILNIGKRSQGTQIGLVNIYRNGTMAETRDGTSLGLLNFGNTGYAALYGNELFFANYEIATGTTKNNRLKNESKTVEIQNVLLYANDPRFLSKEKTRWAFGYGLKKMYFNRTAVPRLSRFRFLSYGVDLMHVNHDEKKLTKDLSLLIRPNVSVGSRLHPKVGMVYLFAAVTYNFYWTDTGVPIAPSTLESSGQLRGSLFQQWPGFSAGIHLH